MKTLTVTLPDSIHQFVEHRAAAVGLDAAGDYVRRLVESDRAAHLRIESLLLEALDSTEEPIEINDAFWAEQHAELERRRATRTPA